jgi:hypothetical protein
MILTRVPDGEEPYELRNHSLLELLIFDQEHLKGAIVRRCNRHQHIFL